MTNFGTRFKTNSHQAWIMFSLFISSLFFTLIVHAAALNAEKHLVQIAKHNQCHIVTNVAPKTDSVARLETEELLAVWCTSSLEESNPLYNILIAIKNDQHDWIDCPSLIPISVTHTSPIMGVKEAKINGKTERLDKYTFLSKDQTAAESSGPESEIADGNGLYIGHWDAEQTLYCYNDKWLISEFH